jgi:hypothetical protein
LNFQDKGQSVTLIEHDENIFENLVILADVSCILFINQPLVESWGWEI